jgi:hypothetical protein
MGQSGDGETNMVTKQASPLDGRVTVNLVGSDKVEATPGYRSRTLPKWLLSAERTCPEGQLALHF